MAKDDSSKQVLIPPPVKSFYVTGGLTDESRLYEGCVNTIVQSIGNSVGVRARPGLNKTNLSATETTGYLPAYGAHFWQANATFYYVLYISPNYTLLRLPATNLAVDGTSIQTVTGGTYEQRMEFIEYYDGTNQYLVLLTGTNGYRISTDHTVTAISDTDFPNPHIPQAVAKDGYLFLAARNTNFIYNSAVTDVTSWTATGRIAAEEKGGNIISLQSHKQSIVAITDRGIEFFRNAGIPAPNSPLTRQSEHFKHYMGLVTHTCLQYEDKIWFIGKDLGHGSSWSLCEISDYQLKEHNNKFIALRSSGGIVIGATSSGGTTGWGSPLYPIRWEGRTFIVLDSTLIGTTITTYAETSRQPALAYDPEYDTWAAWSYTRATSGANWTVAGNYLANGLGCIGSYPNYFQSSSGSYSDSLLIDQFGNNPGTVSRLPVAVLLQGADVQGFDYTNGSRKVAIRSGFHFPFGLDTSNHKSISRARAIFLTQPATISADGNMDYRILIFYDAWADSGNADLTFGPYDMRFAAIATRLGLYRNCRIMLDWDNGDEAPLCLGLQLNYTDHQT